MGFRTPWGPSDTRMEGILSLGRSAKNHKDFPEMILSFSENLSSETEKEDGADVVRPKREDTAVVPVRDDSSTGRAPFVLPSMLLPSLRVMTWADLDKS